MIFFVFYETLDHMQLKHLIYYKFTLITYALTMPKIAKHEKTYVYYNWLACSLCKDEYELQPTVVIAF
jgi:hypothetical protein